MIDDKDFEGMFEGLRQEYNSLIIRRSNGEDVESELEEVKHIIFTSMFYAHELPRIKNK